MGAHRLRIQKSDSDACKDCQVPDTPAHILIKCRRFDAKRELMREFMAASVGCSTRDVKTLSAHQVETSIGDEINVVEMLCDEEHQRLTKRL